MGLWKECKTEAFLGTSCAAFTFQGLDADNTPWPTMAPSAVNAVQVCMVVAVLTASVALGSVALSLLRRFESSAGVLVAATFTAATGAFPATVSASQPHASLPYWLGQRLVVACVCVCTCVSCMCVPVIVPWQHCSPCLHCLYSAR